MASIRKRGSKFHVQVRRTGSPSATKTFLRRKDAEEWARHAEIEADRKELPRCTKILDQTSLGDLVERYRDEIVPRKRGSDVETIVLNAFLRDSICTKKLAALTPLDFAAYRHKRLLKITSISLKRQLAPLHNMFEVARTEWEMPLRQNPLDILFLKAPDRSRQRRLREGELERLVSATKKTRNRYILPIILFAIETAMRRGEILAMRWDQVDLDRRLAAIPDTKNGHSRVIPLTQAAVEVLANLVLKDGNVFPVTPNALRLSWCRLTERAAVADLHFHDLRHEAISRFFEMRLTVPEIASISGHRDMRMLLRYAHADMQSLARKIAEATRDRQSQTHSLSSGEREPEPELHEQPMHAPCLR